MLRKISVLLLIGATSQLYAFDKNQVILDQVFWGTWQIQHPQMQCKEVYEFSKPGHFTHQTLQKRMTGDFVVLRSPEKNEHDILQLAVKTDNGLADCSGERSNFAGQPASFALKWSSPRNAELCLDAQATRCTGLQLVKQP